MNTMKFRKDRGHKSRDKRRIVEVHCKLLQVSLPRFAATIVAQFSFSVARKFQRPDMAAGPRVSRPANFGNIYRTSSGIAVYPDSESPFRDPSV